MPTQIDAMKIPLHGKETFLAARKEMLGEPCLLKTSPDASTWGVAALLMSGKSLST